MKALLVSRAERSSPADDSAEVVLRSVQGEIVAVSFPCEVEAGASIPNRLHVLDGDIKAAYLADWPDKLRTGRSAEQLERTLPFSYRGIGRVIDQPADLVEALGFVFHFANAPCGGHVEFECLPVAP